MNDFEDISLLAQQYEAGRMDAGRTRLDYKQAHTYDYIISPEDLHTDQLTLHNNYMKLIFGGVEDHFDDAKGLQRSYANIDSDVRASSTLNKSVLNRNLSSFIPRQQGGDNDISKDEILQTFASMRKALNPTEGDGGSDVAKGLHYRATPATTMTFYHGKGKGRFHKILGSGGHLLDATHDAAFRPQQSLSSFNYAPREDGSQVPLFVENYNDYDTRNIDEELVGVTRLREPTSHEIVDDGMYAGSDINQNTGGDEGNLRALFRKTI